MKKYSNKVWIGFGVITIISGIFLIFSGDYLIGFSGSSVGILLIYQNMMVMKDGSNQAGFDDKISEKNDK